DAADRIERIEEAGRHFGAALGMKLTPGMVLAAEQRQALAAAMADRLFEAIDGGAPQAAGSALMRLDPLAWRGTVEQISFSGGVAEYIYGGDTKSFGDLGLPLAAEIRERAEQRGLRLARPHARIPATLIGP